jgi:hypothetical protein
VPFDYDVPFDSNHCSRRICNPAASVLVGLVRQHRAIALILIGFIILGTVYSVVTPLFEASDELWHYPFIQHLADGGEVRWLNPHADIGVETADRNLNMVVHSERENFPYRGTARPWRCTSCAFFRC